jgi:hypothetical protein
VGPVGPVGPAFAFFFFFCALAAFFRRFLADLFAAVPTGSASPNAANAPSADTPRTWNAVRRSALEDEPSIGTIVVSVGVMCSGIGVRSSFTRNPPVRPASANGGKGWRRVRRLVNPMPSIQVLRNTLRDRTDLMNTCQVFARHYTVSLQGRAGLLVKEERISPGEPDGDGLTDVVDL